jgi:hypothetical protein
MKQFYSTYSIPLKDSPDSSVGIGMAEESGFNSREKQLIFLLRSVQIDSGAPPVSLYNVYRGLFLRETDGSSPYSAEVKHAGIYLRSPIRLQCVVLN